MEELQYSKELAEGIHRFFTENDWKYSFDENSGLLNGNFEFDMDGEMIRYKIFVDLGEGISPDKILGAGIVYSSTMFERYGDGILDILFAGASALETIEKCERKLDAEEL